MRLGSGEEGRGRRRTAQHAAIAAAAVFLCCCAAVAYTTWNGQHTTSLSASEACGIIDSPATTIAQKRRAVTQLFRLAEDGQIQRARLEQLAGGDGELAELARQLLCKLKR